MWHRIDYDALWSSDKLNRCSDEAQADYPWVYGLADAHGCFELTNPRVPWSRVAAVRKKLTLERFEQDFREYHENGLCFIWEQVGKKYGYWTNSEGRLPPLSVRSRYARSTPPPPKNQLEEYLSSFSVAATKAAPEDLKPSLEVVATDSRLYRDNRNGTGTEGEPKTTACRPAADASPPSPQPAELSPEGEQSAQPQSQPSEEQPPKPNAHLLLEIYEQERGPLPAVKAESRERLSKSRARLLSHAKDQERFLATFRAAVTKASQIRWPTWRPSFDWFVANDTNYVKVLEGNYDHWADRNGATDGTGSRNRKAGGAVAPPPGKYESRKPDFEFTN